MRTALLKLVALNCILFASVVNAGNQMYTTGTFGVNRFGAATYSIPIRMPTGVGGFEPHLAFSYNSQADNGLLGVGWSLSGLSAITRCPATVAHDTVNITPGTNRDRYCLDGLPLRGNPSNNYFQTNADIEVAYRNFLFDKSEIFPIDGKFFQLTNSAGQKAIYGKTADSFLQRTVTTSRSTVLADYGVWAISELTALAKYNLLKMNFHYTKDAANGELYPSSIDFPATTKSVPVTEQNSVQFSYESRPDVEVRYSGGMKLQTSVRLKEIRTYYADKLVHSYKLSYDQDPVTGRSRLISLVECAGDGACLPPTVMTYAASKPLSFGSTIQSAVLDWGQESGRAWVDINGDGFVDFCRVIGLSGANKLACTLSTGNGFGDTITSAVMDPGLPVGRAWTDVNGDGLPDYCRLTGTTNLSDSRAECLLSTGGGFGASVTSGVLDWGVESKRAWRDVDGDGRADYCISPTATSSDVRCAFSTGAALSAPVLLGSPRPIGPPGGDSPSDTQNFICRANNSGEPDRQFKRCLFFSAYNGTSGATLLLGWGASAGRAFADFNADGYGDYCRVIGAGSSSKLACTLSVTTTNYYFATNAPNASAGVDVVSDVLDVGNDIGRFWIDVNMDGRADYCRRIGSAKLVDSRIACTFSANGTQFGTTLTSDILDWGQDTGSDWVDFRGEGHPAYCRVTGTVNGQDSRLSCTPLLIEVGGATQIASSIDKQISITYKPLTDSNIYSKDNAATYPLIDVVSGLYVATEVSVSNGIGGKQKTNYKYGGQKFDLATGLGNLGFRWIQAINAATSLSTLTEYSQVWPYLGLPLSVKSLLPGSGFNGVLSQQGNTYDCKYGGGSSPCTPSYLQKNPQLGAALHIYTQTSVESRWDLNGAQFPTVTTNTLIDKYTDKTKTKTVSTSDGFTTVTDNAEIEDSEGNGVLMKYKTTETRTKQ